MSAIQARSSQADSVIPMQCSRLDDFAQIAEKRISPITLAVPICSEVIATTMSLPILGQLECGLLAEDSSSFTASNRISISVPRDLFFALGLCAKRIAQARVSLFVGCSACASHESSTELPDIHKNIPNLGELAGAIRPPSRLG